MEAKEQDALSWAVVEKIGEADLLAKINQKRPLTVKLGVDPTSTELHLGHAVVLRKLRQWQDLGHRAVLVIGDFTARIGDPAGVNTTRPVLSQREISRNMKNYFNQAGLILDIKRARVVHNSDWLDRLSFADLLSYAQQVSVNNLIEREDFAARLKAGQKVGLHELLYPLTQAIDSVELKADVELGGWDQRLNLLLGRELQKKMGQSPQALILMEPLIGLDGKRKMSSSLNNFIGLTESAAEMFGKVMSIPDQLIIQYGSLGALMGSLKTVERQLTKLHPREQKALVAKRIVALYHGGSAAAEAEAGFNRTFRDKEVANHLAAPLSFSESEINIITAVVSAADCSRTQAHRLLEQGAIKLDGKKVTSATLAVDLHSQPLLQVGKHTWRKLRIRE